MRIEITGKQIDVGDALRERLTERLGEALGKYSVRPVEAVLTISRDAHLYVCDCLTHLSTGLTAQASAKGDDIHGACDHAIARLEKQLRRHKRRLKDHHQKRAEPVPTVPATRYVIDGDFAEADAEVEAPEPAPADDLWTPAIIAENDETIPSLSVGEAVMQMELKGAHFLFFVNDAQKRLNVVYRRDDGHVGWIDPSLHLDESGAAR